MTEYLKRDDVLTNSEILTFDTRDYGRIDVIPVEYLADLPTVELKTVKDVVVPNLEKHNIKRSYPNMTDSEVAAYILGFTEYEKLTDTMIDKKEVLRIIESFKVFSNQKLSKEDFNRNFTLQLIQEEISGTICGQED